ncbi:hypothetical protein BDR05DRAFT_439792 [Suillus weaverae]|nr:hypothetical protein BDR05DRAFT_439792 [Suillus weaverae]
MRPTRVSTASGTYPLPSNGDSAVATFRPSNLAESYLSYVNCLSCRAVSQTLHVTRPSAHSLLQYHLPISSIFKVCLYTRCNQFSAPNGGVFVFQHAFYPNHNFQRCQPGLQRFHSHSSQFLSQLPAHFVSFANHLLTSILVAILHHISVQYGHHTLLTRCSGMLCYRSRSTWARPSRRTS